MRTLWVLILFGSLIIHHCFTTTSGEAVPSNKETQPSYSDCKPYVDAALKGDIPPEATPPDPADISSEENKDHGSEDQDHDHDYDKKLQSDESNEEENTGSSEESHTGSTGAVNVESSEEEDKEEPEINGLEIEEDEQADENKGSDATAEDSSEEEPPPATPPQAKLPPPPPPKPLKEPTRSPKATKAEEPAKKDDAQSNESDENDTREAVTSNPAPTTPQPNRASHNSVAKDTHEPTPSRSSPPPTPSADKTDNKNKKVSNPTKETQSEVKKPVPPRVTEDSDEDSVEEEIVVKKNVKTTKEDSKSKPVESEEADNDSDEEIKTKAKKPVKKIVKIDDASDESESEEDVQEVKPKKANKPKAKESKVKAAPKKPVDDSDEDDNDDRSAEKDYEPRSRDKIIRILGLDDTTDLKQKNGLLDKVTQQTLKELKSTYEYAIKPLETLYKYRDLSNRHFGDPEIFSKPMIVFMGPWSGGKSTIINWLLGIQDDEHALRTGADPSPAQFNILTHGSEEEVLDGTQLAADWTFSGLQKFGQSFLDRLRGRKLPNRLLEKVNLVEIPGILEIRKQVERSFPFNDACQWFIDRADVLFLVYDPAKLDIGPETEAILDQLKGRESQVRIVLNKADTVKPDELLRVQATLIWNISPLMASAEPPVLYVASLWDHPLQPDAPASLLNAHETLFLKDISDATHKRVETRIAAARRFAVRVRNHAKMCDCYLNTYNNHRSFFSNKKRISDDIIEHPQNYHIYEGLSTLTNISRYDLPDPDSYRDFFRLNPVWEFPTLASTCTYFRGCPINKLDIAIAYDLPELLGRYRRQRESIVTAPTGTLPDIKLKDVAEKKDAPIDIPKGKSRWYKLPLEEQQAQQVETPPPKGKPKEAPATPQPPSKKEPPQKPKNKWWKEVPEVVAKVEVKGNKDEGAKKSKKEEVVVKKLKPKEGFNIIQPKNKWWNEYYEPIKSKDPQPQLPKKNKWYKT